LENHPEADDDEYVLDETSMVFSKNETKMIDTPKLVTTEEKQQKEIERLEQNLEAMTEAFEKLGGWGCSTPCAMAKRRKRIMTKRRRTREIYSSS